MTTILNCSIYACVASGKWAQLFTRASGMLCEIPLVVAASKSGPTAADTMGSGRTAAEVAMVVSFTPTARFTRGCGRMIRRTDTPYILWLMVIGTKVIGKMTSRMGSGSKNGLTAQFTRGCIGTA